MVLNQFISLRQNKSPLAAVQLPVPVPDANQVLIKVATCGVCHTELDEIEGRTPPPQLPVILGHQVVGRVVETGPGAKRLRVGERVGVAWISSACGQCRHCQSGDENLCEEFRATGRDVHNPGFLFLPGAKLKEILRVSSVRIGPAPPKHLHLKNWIASLTRPRPGNRWSQR